MPGREQSARLSRIVGKRSPAGAGSVRAWRAGRRSPIAPLACSWVRNARFPVLDDLPLLVSEVVTNAVRHAGGPDGDALRVRIAALPGHVRVEVLDPQPRL